MSEFTGVQMTSRRERFCMHNSLIALVQVLTDHYITIELKNGTMVSGKLCHVDGYMNVNLEDAILLTADEKQHVFDDFFLQARSIKYFSIPQHLLQAKLGGEEPCCLYVGDNLIQDIVTPAQHTSCHTVAVIEELWAEDGNHPDKATIESKVWGSYFGTPELPSASHGFLTRNSHLIVPNFETLAQLPLSGPVPVGFYPKPPLLHQG